MPSLTEFPWSRISPETQQRLGERLRGHNSASLHTPSSVTHPGNWHVLLSPPVCPLVVHLDRSCSHPPRTSEGLELHQLLQALQAAVADPVWGHPVLGLFLIHPRM